MELVSRVTEAYLRTAEGTDAARLRFLEGLWDIQSRIESANRPYTAPSADAAREALVSGRSLFAVSAPEVPLSAYADAVSDVAHYAADMAGLPAEQANALRDVDFAAALGEEMLAEAVTCVDAFVEQVVREVGAVPDGPLTPASVAFVLISALVPFLTGPAAQALESLGEVDWRSWGRGRCPVCGAAAAMGHMGETTTHKGAERTLWCGVCHAEWGYERMRCVRCGSRNPEKLRYSHVEGDPAHRVHLCDECHGYVRFVFLDDLEKPLSMVVEDAVTTTLEAIALEQGYTATGNKGSEGC